MPMKRPGQRVEDEHADQRRDGGDEVDAGGDAVELPDRAAVYSRASLRSAPTSTSSTTAAMTTAASVASGSSSKRPVRNSSVTIVSTATTSPESCDFAPAAPLTAVLDRLPLTTMPLESPLARFAAPSPISSRLASIS